jgi:predicted component of type VI protein secretion system
MIYIFRDLSIILDSTKLRQVYLTLVEWVINYGIIGWGGAFNKSSKRIISLSKSNIENDL